MFSNLHVDSTTLYTYKIILVPPEEVAAAFHQFRADLVTTYSIERTGTSTPQIILANFLQNEAVEAKLVERLARLAKTVSPLRIMFNGFGAYPGHTIFMQIDEGEKLMVLVKEMKMRLAQLLKCGTLSSPGFMSNPHLTLVRKLPAWKFAPAWAVYKDKTFTATYTAHTLTLVRRAPGQPDYRIIGNFPLDGTDAPATQLGLF